MKLFNLIPLITSWIFLYILIDNGVVSRHIRCRRTSILFTSILWSVLLVMITELLSLFRNLTYKNILLSWLVLSIIFGAAAFRCGFLKLPDLKPLNISSGYTLRKNNLLITGLLVVIILSGLTALYSIPNSYVSLETHMPRIMHWIQNKSVAHYPTNMDCQLTFGPGSEFIMLHILALTGDDRLANLVQWLSMIGVLVGVSLIAKMLGAGERGQIMSSVICAAIPIGILQSVSTENQYVLSFWLVCFVYFVLLLKKSRSWFCSVAIGGALGLAVLTQPIAYVWLLLFILFFSIFKGGRGTFLWMVLISLLMFSLTNFSHYKRNYDTYGLLYSPFVKKFINAEFSPAIFASNLLRNSAMHIGTPFDKINNSIENTIIRIHALIEMDPYDEKTTYDYSTSLVNKYTTHEEHASNLIHFLLIFFFTSTYLIRARRKIYGIGEYKYLFACLGGSFIFSFLLKWEETHTRLHLPLFVLFSPLIGLNLSRFKKRYIVNFIILTSLIYSIPFLIANKTRPLINIKPFTDFASVIHSADESIFYNIDTELADAYRKTINFIEGSGKNNIYLLFPSMGPEYPFWRLLRKKGNFTIRHVIPGDYSNKVYEEGIIVCVQPQEEFGTYHCEMLKQHLGAYAIEDFGRCKVFYKKSRQ